LTPLDSINHEVFLGFFPQFSIFGIQIQNFLTLTVGNRPVRPVTAVNRPVTNGKSNPGWWWSRAHRRYDSLQGGSTWIRGGKGCTDLEEAEAEAGAGAGECGGRRLQEWRSRRPVAETGGRGAREKEEGNIDDWFETKRRKVRIIPRMRSRGSLPHFAAITVAAAGAGTVAVPSPFCASGWDGEATGDSLMRSSRWRPPTY
jgi:hypothetical protein